MLAYERNSISKSVEYDRTNACHHNNCDNTKTAFKFLQNQVQPLKTIFNQIH